MMKIILLILLLSSITLSAGVLRVLNIPVNSEIIIDGKLYANNQKRSMNIELENKLLSYKVEVKNQYFMPYTFKASVSKEKPTIHTLEMKYAREYFTNIFVEDIDGDIDKCSRFTCKVESGRKITDNVYMFSENLEDKSVDFTTSKRGYYDETDTYDVSENQIVTIEPVSSWGLFSIGYISSVYPVDEEFTLENGDIGMYYFIDDTPLEGAKFSYRKNTIFNFFIGMEINYLTAKEEHPEEGENLDENPDDSRHFTGTPSINIVTAGLSVGYRYHRWFLEAGTRQEMISVSKAYTDGVFTHEESRVSSTVSLEYLFWKMYHGGLSVGVTSSSEGINTAYIQALF